MHKFITALTATVIILSVACVTMGTRLAAVTPKCASAPTEHRVTERELATFSAIPNDHKIVVDLLTYARDRHLVK